jgi:hypothetical protein
VELYCLKTPRNGRRLVSISEDSVPAFSSLPDPGEHSGRLEEHFAPASPWRSIPHTSASRRPPGHRQRVLLIGERRVDLFYWRTVSTRLPFRPLHSGIRTMMSRPGPEHAWLQQLVGEWTYEILMEMGPGEPPAKLAGTQSIRPISSLWIQAEEIGPEFNGDTAPTILTLGYDQRQQRFVGSWLGSMTDNLWIYLGSRTGDVLTLECVAPNFDVPGAMANYRDVMTMAGSGERTMESFMQEADGSWTLLVKTTYRRKS